MITSGLLHTPLCRYHETTTQQPIRQAADQFQHQRASTCISRPTANQIMQEKSSPRATTIISIPGFIDIHPRLTKDWINWDIDHPASVTYASISLTVSRFLTVQVHLRPAPITETFLISLTRCHQELKDSRVYLFPQYRLSTTQRLNRHYTATTIHTPMQPFVNDSLYKVLAF